VDRYQWLLALHVTGAFLLMGGGAIAASLNLAALRRDRPSDIVVLFGLIRIAVASILVGSLLALVFGLLLVHDAGYGYGDGWVVASLVLFVLGNALGGMGGRRDDPDGAVRARARGDRRRAQPRAPRPRSGPGLARAQLGQRTAPRDDPRAERQALGPSRMGRDGGQARRRPERPRAAETPAARSRPSVGSRLPQQARSSRL
jgi:hypothetical protein